MANILQIAPTSFTSYVDTALNSLANGAMVIGAAIDNSSDRYTLVRWRLNLNTITPTAGGYIELYCLPGDAAGGNFAEGSDAIQPQSCYLKWLWPLRATSAAPYHFTDPLALPVYSKWLIRNASGAAFNAASNVLAHSFQNLTVE
jgi:hypothetical protein